MAAPRLTRAQLLAPLMDGGADPAIFDDWELVPGVVGGVHVCTAALSGTEIHFGIVPAYRRQLIRRFNTQAFLAPLLARWGLLTTRVRLDRHSQQRFVERLGFVRTWADDTCQYYLLADLPFTRTR